MREWWQELSVRERRTLGLGGVALTAILFYFLLWQPLSQNNAQLERDLREAHDLLSWMQPAVAEIRALGGTADGPTNVGRDRALFALADQHAREAGLGRSLEQVEPMADGSARVVLEQVGFDQLVRWLGSLRTGHGVEATSVSLRRAEVEGRVNAQIVLQRPDS